MIFVIFVFLIVAFLEPFGDLFMVQIIFGIGFACVTAIFWGGNFTFSCQSQSVSYLRIQIQIGKAVFSTIIAQALGLVTSRLPET